MSPRPAGSEIGIDPAEKLLLLPVRLDEVGAHVRREIDRYLDEHGLELVRLPIQDEMERRAVCLRFAIESKAWISLRRVDDKDERPESEQIIALARTFQGYIEGDA